MTHKRPLLLLAEMRPLFSIMHATAQNSKMQGTCNYFNSGVTVATGK